MEVFIFLVPMALALGLLGALSWSLTSGHFDDLDDAAWRALIDEDDARRLEPSDRPSAKCALTKNVTAAVRLY